MKVKDLKGKEHIFRITGYMPEGSDNRPRSKYHLLARELLQDYFALDLILEEVPVPGERLFLDFFLPIRKLAVEVHGEQHYKFNSRFHADISDFKHGQLRDKNKQAWCELNNITLLILKYDDTTNWPRRIANY